ncbi:mannuronate-specific alginate lyase [Cellvibrio sp. KY-GH-1]|uniref:alginate lyase family protein n=1 Tax=Cellvibrio sp. KY-GH-1 TaxID=2303332 RepID=UPI001247C9C4|nr:alginate lyase family protein [Cellvibrio sp. KY-GH-1]QEY16453.1 mannuronate-specific alginate lyase [Cellvibrio sp. KY-GH-1]
MKAISGILALIMLSCVGNAYADIKIPAGFKRAPLMPNNNLNISCPKAPPPFKGSLLFTSKYEGTDDANSIVNPDALDDYLEQTNDMTELQRVIADLSNKYLRTGNVIYRNCALDVLSAWAQSDALLSKSSNHTGAAVRKWTLAAIAAGYAKIVFSSAPQPAIAPTQKQLIEGWLEKMAVQVIADYATNSVEKVNNHDYWAAWAVGVSATFLNRTDLLQWSYEKYVQAMGQVDIKTGYLPNELKRKGLALSYHHYAVQPLVSLAVLLKTNGYEVFKHNNSALERLVSATLRATVRPQLMAEVAEENQKTDKLVSGSGLSWLEPWLVLKPDAIIPFRWQQLRPMTSSRLGGDLTLIYAEKYVEKSSSYLSHPRPPLINQINAWPYGRNIFDDKVFAYYRRNFNRTTPLI